MSSLKDYVKTSKAGDVLLPTLQEFVSTENRLVKEGKASHKTMVVDDCKLTIDCMKSRMEEFNHGEPPQDHLFVHPSSIGACMRQLWYSHFDAPQSIKGGADELKTYFIFETGTYFHVFAQNLLERAGILTKREIAIVDTKNSILGHCDGEVILPSNGEKAALELKTMNSRMFTGLTAPMHSHKMQAHCYMKALGLKYCVFMYFDKGTSLIKEFLIKFSKKFWLTEVKTRIQKFQRHVMQRTMPERETEGANKFPCIFCSHIDLCYSDEQNTAFLKSVRGTKQTGPTMKPKRKFKLGRKK